jgi:hypothetical protein
MAEVTTLLSNAPRPKRRYTRITPALHARLVRLKARGLTHEEIATRVGICPATVSRVLSKTLTRVEVSNLATRLGVDRQQLRERMKDLSRGTSDEPARQGPGPDRRDADGGRHARLLVRGAGAGAPRQSLGPDSRRRPARHSRRHPPVARRGSQDTARGARAQASRRARDRGEWLTTSPLSPLRYGSPAFHSDQTA